MAIQPRFRPAILGFCLVLASGTITPAAADADLEYRTAPGATSLTIAEEPIRPEPSADPSVERSLGDTGSVREWLPIDPAPEPPVYPLVMNARVQHFLDRFTREHREVVGLWVTQSGRYLGMIREVLRSRGMPEDLAFTAMIESGFNPRAVSRAGAVGMWQFMPATARRYGLRVDRWVDERRDPEKSTFAAAAYLRDLYQQFGSWSLAQAAYNAGEMTVVRAIRATGSTDFWVLSRSRYLRQETKEFVPRIHAATVIGRDPARYGFDVGDTTVVAFEIVSVPPSTELRWLAASAGVPVDTVKLLNPTLVRGVTPPGRPYELKLPLGTGHGVLTALEAPRRDTGNGRSAPRVPRAVSASQRQAGVRKATAVTSDRPSGVHVVRPRDTVSGIAKHYGVSVNDLLRWNSLEKQSRIRPGDRLNLSDSRLSSDRQASLR
jgi:membrane-bound lytic murein transglycosylase D